MSYGQIVLANTKSGIEASILRTVMGVNLTHSLVTIPSILDIPMCIEADASEVDTLRFDTEYLQNPDQQIEIWEVNISDEMKDEGIKEAINKLETTYGFLELPWFLYRKIMLILGKDIKKQNNWCQNGEICSQLCQLYLTGCGLGFLFKDYGICSIHPGDLQKIMQENPKYFTKTYSNF